MTDQEYIQYHDDRIAELPRELILGAVNIFSDHVDDKTKDWVVDLYTKHKHDWIHAEMQHLHWGMAIRNLFRTHGITDDQLPTKNWDDYYIQIIEIALGLRELP